MTKEQAVVVIEEQERIWNKLLGKDEEFDNVVRERSEAINIAKNALLREIEHEKRA